MPSSAPRLSPLLAIAICTSPAVGQQDADGEAELLICVRMEVDLFNDETSCTGVQISYGSVNITAGQGQANKSALEGSEWQLTDEVRIAFESAEIRADSARFEFGSDELIFGELRGDPVVMSDYIEESDTVVRGTADNISYDSRNGTLRLLGKASFVWGGNEYMGCDWIYNLNDKTFSDGTTDCEISLRVVPPEEDDTLDDQLEAP